MQWCRIVLVVCLVGLVSSGRALPAPRCSPAALEEEPRAARFCAALATFLELYAESGRLEDKPGPPLDYQALFREYPQLLDTGMKRQDVVHNFLRFGRRR
ncbi:myosuppressin-like isoform X2 [Arctopsyche grandis]